MPDFRITQIQAMLFTSDVNYRGARFLAYFLSKWGDLFDGEPTSLDPPSGFPILGFPRAILKSEDTLTQLVVAPERLAFVRTIGEGSVLDVQGHMETAVAVFQDYVGHMQARCGRVAALITRAAPDEEASRTLSRHFCREEWLEGPINRPAEFELHALKRYKMAGVVEVNSWFRCKTGQMRETGATHVEQRAILVEQDMNTLAEGADTRTFKQDEIKEFFRLAPRELDGILRLYFPTPREG